ncbi:hypothetical protein F5884DRAFT_788470 [Xylogone sp. PMI_703]|nr:hypothetical protein F5884DRAFT_788470 [Xylogone sp. PMI_703]
MQISEVLYGSLAILCITLLFYMLDAFVRWKRAYEGSRTYITLQLVFSSLFLVLAIVLVILWEKYEKQQLVYTLQFLSQLLTWTFEIIIAVRLLRNMLERKDQRASRYIFYLPGLFGFVLSIPAVVFIVRGAADDIRTVISVGCAITLSILSCISGICFWGYCLSDTSFAKNKLGVLTCTLALNIIAGIISIGLAQKTSDVGEYIFSTLIATSVPNWIWTILSRVLSRKRKSEKGLQPPLINSPPKNNGEGSEEALVDGDLEMNQDGLVIRKTGSSI